MKLTLGIKSDPIEYRYSFDWLFSVMNECGISLMQLGSFFELYLLEDGFFHELRNKAEKHGIRIKSCFTAHRELGGFFTGNPWLEKAARAAYERYIRVGSILGAEFVGSNPGAIYRDRPETKPAGVACYLRHMKELMRMARESGLAGLTIEPMSCMAEPPSTPEEIHAMLGELAAYHERREESTVPVYLCGDISHGIADAHRRVIHDNFALFETAIPYMAEFHFKNTDPVFNSTFGFSAGEQARGIVDLERLRHLIGCNDHAWPLAEVTGYLEIGGPKTGRDYTDHLLKSMIVESLESLKAVFAEPDRSAMVA